MNHLDEQGWALMHSEVVAQGFSGGVDELRDLWLIALYESTVRFLKPQLKYKFGNEAIQNYVNSYFQACQKRGLMLIIHDNYLYKPDEFRLTICSGRRAPEYGPVRVSSVTIEIIKTGNHEVTVEVEAYRNSESCKRIARKFQRSGKK